MYKGQIPGFPGVANPWFPKGNHKNSSYSLLTSLNSAYFDFGKIWINSMIDKVELSRVDYIFIADTGLNQEHKEYFTNKSSKVYIIDTGINTSLQDGIHGREWLNVVCNKTNILNQLYNQYGSTIMMTDADCMFLTDPYHLIDNGWDLQACFRGWEHQHASFLGSFIILNTNQGNEFVNKWYEEQPTIKTPNKESPALTKAVIKYTSALYFDSDSKYKVGVINTNIVNCNNKQDEIDDTVLVHFKSGGSTKDMKSRILGSVEKSGYFDIAQRYLDDK
jgi:hypothetical protein